MYKETIKRKFITEENYVEWNLIQTSIQFSQVFENNAHMCCNFNALNVSLLLWISHQLFLTLLVWLQYLKFNIIQLVMLQWINKTAMIYQVSSGMTDSQ